MKLKSEIKCIYFLVKISVFIKYDPIFCNRTVNVFKIYILYLSCTKFDAALFNLNISRRVYFYNLPKYFLILPRKPTFLYSGIFWELHVFAIS